MKLRSTKRQKESGGSPHVDRKKLKLDNSEESLKKIVDLNNDCLDEIFSYLSYDDLLSACQVCQRFQNRARNVFRRKCHDMQMFSVKANESNHLLRRIGSALSKLEIFFCGDIIKNQQIIDITTKYCVENLKELTLHCLTKRNKLRKSFSQVNKLTLSYCDMIGCFKLAKWFPNLTSLTFNYTKNLKKYMKQSIPSMHTLNINYLASQMETITILLSNPQIKNLSLNFDAPIGLVIKRSLLAAIDNALPELEALNLTIHRVDNFGTENSSLLHFNSLKSLKIESYADYSNTALINLLAISHTNLERLQLRFSDLTLDSHSYSCITKYKNLRELHLMPTVDFVNVVPWTTEEVRSFVRRSRQLIEMTYIFAGEAQLKFSRTLASIRTQFFESSWNVKSKKRCGPKVFDTSDGVDAVQNQFVISILKDATLA
ncbi:hypothetical protein Bhyg_17256 [Pseudolycoriella hygida]|uniref:F-box domain-containing protein n=1 Tax=Pseudolycoriella hygida TaxID=35572 RepID=A0A9Q0RUC2_9DIPT|nr:hypothetical protein Bhyg_17256 [Pseudolycoriella hygida]